MERRATILVNQDIAGILTETADGEFIFQYDNHYLEQPTLPAVSLTLPKREAPYTAKTLFPFFDGLIPEGWLVDIGIKNWKLNPKDRMGLLLHLCTDCIGNVSVVHEN